MIDLMQKRYKVIAPIPVLPFKVGGIYNVDFYPVTVGGEQFYVRLDSYPHLFKQLEWWEERTLVELFTVKYVKFIGKFRTGEILKVAAPEQNMRQWHISGEIEHRFIKNKDLIPVTEEEYNQYLSTTLNSQTKLNNK